MKTIITPLNNERESSKELSNEEVPVDAQKTRWILCALTFFAFIVRLIVSFPALKSDGSALMRPDSGLYTQGALGFLNNGTYSLQDGGIISFYPPAYSFLLSLSYQVFGVDSLFPSIAGILLSTALVPLTYLIGKRVTTRPLALIAAAFIALNITFIGMAPLILTDTLFAFVVAFIVLFMARFYQSGQIIPFLFAIVFAALSCYIRPVMIFWWVPALFLLWICKGKTIKTKLIVSAVSLLLFFGIQAPWMLRNYVNDVGYVMTSSSGSMFRYNSIVVMNTIQTGEKAETLLARYRAEDNLYFATYPDSFRTLNARNNYLVEKAMQNIKAHPFHFFYLHIRPTILLPDIATVSENLGYSQQGGGTFDVLNRKGYWAAINHYFAGQMWLFYALFPFVLLIFILYIFALFELIIALFQKRFFFFWFFMGCSYYFLFVPGPVSMPRYQMPALFLIAVLGAMGMNHFYTFYFRRQKNINKFGQTNLEKK